MAHNELISEQGLNRKNNSLFEVIFTDREDSIEVTFIDIREKEFQNPPSTTLLDINLEVFKKQINLKKVPVKIEKQEDIEHYLQKEFIEIIKELGLKKNDESISVLDIMLKADDDPVRGIFHKILYRSNYIAVNGRIGSAQYTISSENTNDMLLKSDTYHSLTHIVDKEMDDETIIIGRKNDVFQPGVFLVLNENSLSNIEYNEKGEKYVVLNYEFAVVGFHPEKQYLTMKIKK